MKKNTEVLLREHVENLGRCGDVVLVSPGYARNYLLPQRLAVPATEDNKRVMARRAEKLALEEAAKAAEVAARVEKLSSLRVETTQKADEQGHLYGSVSAALVAELCTQAGTPTDEKSVRLESPIKAVGEHKVALHVHGDSHAEITVVVNAEA